MDRVSVIGLGYVGLPLSIEFGKVYRTVGYDINESRVVSLREGMDSNLEHTSDDILSSKYLSFSSDPRDVRDSNVYLVAVPTPLNRDGNSPDLSCLLDATTLVAGCLDKGDLVVFESSVYPGCTEDVCIPVLERVSGLVLNDDFGVGFSPERINPSKYSHDHSRLVDIVKVVSASNDHYLEKASILYSSVVQAGVFRVSSIKAAESSKMLENIQRDVNIAFMNEMSKFFCEIGVDTFEVLEACKSKWNFLPFYPGLVGGHCICVNPYYLLHSAKRACVDMPVIRSARIVNESMGMFVVDELCRRLVLDSSILIIGVTYKPNCRDIRGSFAFDIRDMLVRRLNARVKMCDNLIHGSHLDGGLCDHGSLHECCSERYDCILVLALHEELRSELDVVELSSLLCERGFIYDASNSLCRGDTTTL